MDLECVNCPQCKNKSGEKNRLIIDSCGHSKCRRCFLSDENLCLQCSQKLDLERHVNISATNAREVQVAKTNKTAFQPKATQTKTSASITLERNHIQKHKTLDGSTEYHCTICDKSFGSRTQQYYHLACGNEDLKKYKCNKCEKQFSSRSHLNYHLESHRTNSYNCLQCGKTFTKLTIFKKHQKLHQILPKKCSECDKQFRHQTSLTAHLAKHKNILLFACLLCDKRYSLKSTLQQHLLKHNEKKYQCKQCGKRFQRTSTLKFHLRNHLKTEEHKCSTCLKVFKDSGALLRHGKTHIGNIKYKCKECDITSTRRDNILRHIRNMHDGKQANMYIEILNQNKQPNVAILNVKAAPSSTLDKQLHHIINDKNCQMEKHIYPKTVENSSVIKCVGNVKPVIIPDCCIEETNVINKKMVESEINITTLKNVNYKSTLATCEDNVTVFTKKLQKKYDPIEMYRKILNSNEDGAQEEDNKIELQQLSNSNMVEQKRTAQNQSNFSETHWRKNFKYTYQYQDY